MALGVSQGAGLQLQAVGLTALDITDKVSISGWLRANVANVSLITHDNDTGAADGYNFGIFTDGKPIFRLWNGSTQTSYSSTASPSAFGRQWRHIGVTADGSRVKFYVDGLLRGSVAQTSVATSAGTRRTEITTSSTHRFHDVRVWAGIAISDSEMMAAARGLRLGNETAIWAVDGRTGFDFTGHGNNLTMGTLPMVVPKPDSQLLVPRRRTAFRTTAVSDALSLSRPLAGGFGGFLGGR